MFTTVESVNEILLCRHLLTSPHHWSCCYNVISYPDLTAGLTVEDLCTRLVTMYNVVLLSQLMKSYSVTTQV